MPKIIKTFFLLLIGFAMGWQLKPEAIQQENNVSAVLHRADIQENPINSEIEKNHDWVELISDLQVLSSDQIAAIAELLKSEMDLNEKDKVNRQLLIYARRLLEENKGFYDTEKKLTALLINNEIEETVLDYLAQLYEKNGRFIDAIKTLYELKSLVQYAGDFVEINNRIDSLVNMKIDRLEEFHNLDKLDAFYNLIIHTEPDNYAYQMRYAEFLYENKNYEQASALLEILVYHQEYHSQAKKLQERLAHQQEIIQSGEFPVPVTKAGEHYIVNAIINDRESVKLIIDTGATMTVLSPEIMHGLNISEEDIIQYVNFSTANGVVSAPVILVEKIKIQNYVVSNIKIGILPSFSQSNFDGLLGMNFLNQFKFFIDQENSTLELFSMD